MWHRRLAPQTKHAQAALSRLHCARAKEPAWPAASARLAQRSCRGPRPDSKTESPPRSLLVLAPPRSWVQRIVCLVLVSSYRWEEGPGDLFCRWDSTELRPLSQRQMGSCTPGRSHSEPMAYSPPTQRFVPRLSPQSPITPPSPHRITPMNHLPQHSAA